MHWNDTLFFTRGFSIVVPGTPSAPVLLVSGQTANGTVGAGEENYYRLNVS